MPTGEVLRLTDEEQAMLAGEEGPGVQRAMEMVVALARIYGAHDLVPIDSAQVAGVSYVNISEAGLQFLRQWAEEGARVRVPAMLNPAGMDLEAWPDMGTPTEFAEKQLEIIAAYHRLGVQLACTCAPYLLDTEIALGDHLAWSESSAVVYANSVVGARTNREGGPGALAAAIVGRTGNYGLHLDQGRLPTEGFVVRAPLRDASDWGALGALIGRESAGVPWIVLEQHTTVGAGHRACPGPGRTGSSAPTPTGLEAGHRACQWDNLRSLGAAAAATGSVALFHLAEITPEARLGMVQPPEGPYHIVPSLEGVRASLDQDGDTIDLVAIGCPHASLQQLAEVARYLEGKRLSVPLWLMASRSVCQAAKDCNLAATLEASGARLVADTCATVAPLREMGIRAVATDSAKAAIYLPMHQGVTVRFGTLQRCLDAALRGSWQ